MTIDCLSYVPQGDKKNSDFFEEYRGKIYERRRAAGLEELLGDMRGIVIQIEHGDALA